MGTVDDVYKINSEDGLKKMLEQKLRHLKEAISLQKKDYREIREELSNAENLERLIEKLKNIYDAVMIVNNSLFRTRGSGNFPIYGAPKPFDDMAKLNKKIEDFLNIIMKIITHLKSDEESLERYEQVLVAAEKVTEANFHRRFSFNPLKGFRNKDFIPDHNIMLGHLRREVVNLDSEIVSFEKKIRINQSELELFSLSLRLFSRLREAMSVYLDRIPKMRIDFPKWYESTVKKLIKELDILVKLIEHLADDEDFINMTDIRILKVIREIDNEDRRLLE